MCLQMPWGRGLLYVRVLIHLSSLAIPQLLHTEHKKGDMTLVQLYLPLSFALFQNPLSNDAAIACCNVKQLYNPMSTAKFLLFLLPSQAQPLALASFLNRNTGNTVCQDNFQETCWWSAPLGQDSEFPDESSKV